MSLRYELSQMDSLDVPVQLGLQMLLAQLLSYLYFLTLVYYLLC